MPISKSMVKRTDGEKKITENISGTVLHDSEGFLTEIVL